MKNNINLNDLCALQAAKIERLNTEIERLRLELNKWQDDALLHRIKVERLREVGNKLTSYIDTAYNAVVKDWKQICDE